MVAAPTLSCAVCAALFASNAPGQDETPAATEVPRELARAIDRLGDASADVRANARTLILRAGAAGIEALRRATQAPDGMLPELLLLRAEAIGAERRTLVVELARDLGRTGWKLAWQHDGRRLAILEDLGGAARWFDRDLEPTGESLVDETRYLALADKSGQIAFNAAGSVRILAPGRDDPVDIPAVRDPSMTLSADGQLVAVGGYSRAAEVYDAEGAHVGSFAVAGTLGGLTPVFSLDGRLLAVGNRNSTTHVFDVKSGEELHVLERRQTQQLAFSPDGRRLAIGYVDGKLGIWDVATGALEALLDSGCAEVFTVAWSRDGTLLASAGLSGPIAIWSGEHLARLLELEPGSERTFGIAFRPDGNMLVATGNGTTRGWSVRRRR